MAGSDKDVNIRIGTEADTSGAESAKEAIDRLSESAAVNPMTDGSQLEALERNTKATEEQARATDEAAEALNDQAAEADKAAKAAEELALAQSRQDIATIQANRSAAEQARQLREIQIAAKGLAALQLIEKLNGALGDLQRLASDRASDGTQLGAKLAEAKPTVDAIASGVKGIGVGLGAAGATGNPIIGLFAGIASQIKDTATAAFDCYEQFQLLEKAEANVVEQAKNLKAAQESVGKAVAASNIENIYNLQALAAERLLTAVQALNTEERARDAAAAAARRFQNEQAVRGGADPGLVAANEAVAGLNDSKAELARQINEARAGLEALQVEADRTFNLASEARHSGTKSAEEIAAANDAYDRANQALGNAEKQVEALERAAEFGKDALVSQAKSTIESNFSQSTERIAQSVTDNANKAIEQIESIRKDAGR